MIVGPTDKFASLLCFLLLSEESIDKAWEKYQDPFVKEVSRVSALVESEGYCKWSRVEEICEFAKKMEFTKIGIATCIGLVDLSNVLSRILESHGFEVASAACKNGGVPKEMVGVRDEEKIQPGHHETMCNPISQAEQLNRAGCELNIVLALVEIIKRFRDLPLEIRRVNYVKLGRLPIGQTLQADQHGFLR